jgi:putative nucleotidyltransferase with HDIG domain
MAVPTRTEALSLLMSTAPSPRLLQHVTVVAELASFLAHRATRADVAVDRRLVETAALLHDIDKALPREHPVRELSHGAGGAAWLREAGHAELAPALLAHPVSRLGLPDAAQWVVEAPIEERIVTYADKRATQRVVSLEQRFDRWRRRHPEYQEGLDRAYANARRLEAELCRVIGIRPDELERLRWVDEAIARAEANGSLPQRPCEAEEPATVPVSADPSVA